MFEKPELAADWQQLPPQPGVYIFKNAAGEILYVGKANNLQQRVGSYARPSGEDWKLQGLLAEAVKIEFRLLENSIAALLFEAQLIRTHQPKFNLLLKNGTPFVYFLFTPGKGAKLPELLLVREKAQPGYYVGPFLQRAQARKIYDFLLHTFALRLCKRKIAGGCMYFHIGVCAGACKADFDVAAYKQRLKQVQQLLEQGTAGLINRLEELINSATQSLNFETARTLNRQLQEIIAAAPMLKQAGIGKITANTAAPPEGSSHIWLLWPENRGLQLFNAHNGLVKQLELWIWPEQSPATHTAETYLRQYYVEQACPGSIFTNFAIDEKAAVEGFLQQWHHQNRPVSIIDRIGETPADIILLAQEMARQTQQAIEQVPKLLAKMVGSNRPIISIDCFDISHHQGQFMVGSCVRFVHGRPDKAHFRRFLVKTVAQVDDYAALREIVTRRYKHGQEDLPDLILIDGGKGQRNAVVDLVANCPLAALAKQEERLFCAQNLQSGLKLDRHRPYAALLIALRDYTHHFAISYHRYLAKKMAT